MRTTIVLIVFLVAIVLIIWRRREVFSLKRKTRRKINRLEKPLNVFSIFVGVFLGLLGLIFTRESLITSLRSHIQPLITRMVPSAPPLPDWLWIASLLVSILLIVLLIVLLGTYLLTERGPRYFEEIDFGEIMRRQSKKREPAF